MQREHVRDSPISIAIKRSIRSKPIPIFFDACLGHDDFQSVIDVRVVVSSVDERSCDDACTILAVEAVDKHRLS